MFSCEYLKQRSIIFFIYQLSNRIILKNVLCITALPGVNAQGNEFLPQVGHGCKTIVRQKLIICENKSLSLPYNIKQYMF